MADATAGMTEEEEIAYWKRELGWINPFSQCCSSCNCCLCSVEFVFIPLIFFTQPRSIQSQCLLVRKIINPKKRCACPKRIYMYCTFSWCPSIMMHPNWLLYFCRFDAEGRLLLRLTPPWPWPTSWFWVHPLSLSWDAKPTPTTCFCCCPCVRESGNWEPNISM